MREYEGRRTIHILRVLNSTGGLGRTTRSPCPRVEHWGPRSGWAAPRRGRSPHPSRPPPPVPIRWAFCSPVNIPNLKMEQLVQSFYVISLVKMVTVSSCCLAVSSCGVPFLQIYTTPMVLCAYIIAKYSTCEPPASPVDFLRASQLVFYTTFRIMWKIWSFQTAFSCQTRSKNSFFACEFVYTSAEVLARPFVCLTTLWRVP
jgi:hypothetical protein